MVPCNPRYAQMSAKGRCDRLNARSRSGRQKALVVSLLSVLMLVSLQVVAYAGSLTGTVRSSAPGPPEERRVVPDAVVQLQGASNFTVGTNASGVYSFPAVPNGIYTLVVSRLGFETSTQPVAITGPPDVQNVTLTSLISFGSVTVSPATATPGATVSITYEITNPTASTIPVTLGAVFYPAGTTTGEFWDTPNEITVSVPPGTGSYSRNFILPSSLAAGNYDFWARIWANPVPTWNPLFWGLEVFPNALSITAVPVNGTVTSSASGQVPGATVQLQGTSTLSTTTNSSGQYTFANVPAGNYTLVVSRSGFQTSSQAVTVASSPLTRNVTLTSQISLAIASATVTPNPAAPSSTVTVTYRITNSTAANVSVLLAGYFSVSGSGTIAFDDTAHAVTVTVTPGTATYSRTFAVPASASGTYDLIEGIWGNPPASGYYPLFYPLSTKSSALLVGVFPPDLSLTKSHTGNFSVGTNGSYTITVSNAASAGSTTGAITMTDVLPAGLSYVSGTGTGWSCGAVGQTVTCTHAGALAGGSSAGAITLTVGVGAAAAPSVTNTASVATAGETATGNNSASDPTTVIGLPDLTISKTHTGDFTVGTNGSYSITVSNGASAGPTTGAITVTDVLPTGLTYVSGTGTGWSCGAVGQTVTCTRAASLAGGASAPAITLTAAVGAAAVPSVTNTASASTPGETATGNNSSSNPTTVIGLPDLTISKTHTGNFTVGTNGTYSITVSNGVSAGPTTGAITVTDVLPTGLTYVSAAGTTWSCGAVGQTVTCTRASSLAGASTTPAITLTVATGAAAAPSVTNTASVSTPGETATGNNSDSDPTTVGSLPDLSITKAHSGNFTVGTNGVYTITVANSASAGPTTGAITVTDTLPAGLTYVSATGTGWSCGVSSQTVTCTRAAALAAGGSAPAITLTVGVGAAAAPSVTNTASVSTPGETATGNNSDSDPTTVIGLPDLSITKAHSGSFTVGTNGVYTITVANSAAAGPTTGAITVTDTLPAGLTYVSGAGTGLVLWRQQPDRRRARRRRRWRRAAVRPRSP